MKSKQSELKAVIEEVVKEVLEETKESEEASDTDTNESEQVNESPEPTGDRESPYGLSPEMEKVRLALAQAEDLLYEHGSDPELTDAYIALLRAMQHGGVNLNYLIMSV